MVTLRTCQEEPATLFAKPGSLHTELSRYQVVARWYLDFRLDWNQEIHTEAGKVFLLINPYSFLPVVLDQVFKNADDFSYYLVAHDSREAEVVEFIFGCKLAIEESCHQHCTAASQDGARK